LGNGSGRVSGYRDSAPAPLSPLDRVVVSTTSPPRSSPPRRPPARHVVVVAVVSSVAAVVVAGPSLPSLRSAAVARSRGCPPARSPAAGRRNLAAASPCHRCHVVQPPVVRVHQSSEPNPPMSPLSSSVRRRHHRCRRRRRSLSSSSPPSSLHSPSPSSPPSSSSTLSVTGRAAVVVVRVGSSSPSSSPSSVMLCLPLSVAGCHRLVVTVVRRPSPPLSSLILASTSSPLSSPVVVLSHPAAGIADLGLGCYTSVVVGSPWSSSGRGCARRRRLAVFRCWREPGDRTRQNMRATPALPILHLDSAVSIKTTRSTRILKSSLRRTSKAFLPSAQLPFTSTANSASSRCLTHARRVPRPSSSSLSRATVPMADIALDSLSR